MADLECNKDLRALNSLAVSARARFFTRIESEAELIEALRSSEAQESPLLVIGGGSNLVLSGDFAGLCIQMALKGVECARLDDDWVCVTAAAGEGWHAFVEYCLDQGWYGLENLALIPGTLGACPIQNVGAYGVEIKDFFSHLDAIDRQTLERRRFSLEECRFGYRDSIFKTECRDRYIITSVAFRLRLKPCLNLTYKVLAGALASIPQPSPRDLFDAVIGIRSSKLPDPVRLPNAGSFFKNPVVSRAHFKRLKEQYPDIVAYPDSLGVKLAAGWMIDRAGWKGTAHGKAAVHDAQALVLVNHGGADGRQILDLAHAIQKDIFQRYGVEIEIEPRVY